VARRLGAVVGLAFALVAALAGLFLGASRGRNDGPPAKGEAALPSKATAAGLGDRALVRLGLEVRAVVAAPCPSDLVYPIDGARRVELSWGLSVSGPADVRFKAVLRTADRSSHVLVDETVTGRTGAKPTWFSRVIDLPADTQDATVVLRTRGVSSASFWAAPVFSRSPAVKPTRNVILVSLDTVRADHLNAYGYTRRRTSPEFDGWAGKGTLFEAAMSAAPGTLSSQMSILTGRYPSRHGVSYANWRLRGRMPVLRLDTPTLAEVLGPQGFLTAAFTGSGYFALPIGYSRGFGEFVSSNDEALGSAATVFEKAFAWLERHRDDPFFLFLHTYEAHEPYLDRRFVEQEGGALQGPKARNEALYDGDIRRADAYLGKLRRHLERLGLDARTLVVTLSDHGEEFGDHFPVWNDGHGHSLFEEQIHVPLMMVGPLVPAGRRVKQAVDLTAVAPTLLDFLGAKLPDGMDGRSLLGLIGGRPEAEGDGLAFSEDVWIGPATRAVRTRDWKLIERGEVLPERFVDNEDRRLISQGVDALAPQMLFELAVDPREQENQLGSDGPVAARLGRLLGARLAAGSHAGPDAEIEVEGEVLDRLRALGYVQ
jgi:arylsulfatase A-like enzyme